MRERKSQSKQSKLSKQQVQQFHQNSLKTNQRYQVLCTLFQTLKLINDDKNSPGLYATEINKNIDNKMVPASTLPPRKGPLIDPKAVYPLNKSGAFGVLVRQCTIVDKGIEEKQGNGAPKFKEIVDFNNRIQQENGKNNEKLDWIKENKQFPFRLILKDKQKKIKAIYFKTKAQAQNIRIHFVTKFLYKGNFLKTMQQSQNIYKMKTVMNFQTKMNIYKNEKKSAQSQKKNSLLDGNRDRNSRDNSKNNNSVNNSKLQDAKGKGYSADIMKSMIDKEQSRKDGKSQAKNRVIKKLEESYKKGLFQVWAKKANAMQERNRQAQLKKASESQARKPALNSRPQDILSKGSQIKLTELELLREQNILLKPIVTIQLYKSESSQAQQQKSYTTIICKKDPHLIYQLIPESSQPNFKLPTNISQYEINIKVLDYLTNTEIYNERIAFKNRVIADTTWLTDEMKRIRVKLCCWKNGAEAQPVEDFDNPEGSFLEIRGISEKVVEEIRGYWEKESVRRGYYNINKDIKIIQIFQLCEQPPKSWALGLSQADYKIMSLLTSAQKILHLRLPRSILAIIKVLQKLYSETPQLVQVLLSLLTSYLHPYYSLPHLPKPTKLHTLLSFQGQLQLSSRQKFQHLILKKLIQIQTTTLVQKFKRRNLYYVHLLDQYIYQIFSKNFKIRVLVELWNFMFRDITMIPVYLMLLAVWIVRYYEGRLVKCHRLREVVAVLESKETPSAEHIIKQMIFLRQKYFSSTGQSQGLLSNLKSFLSTNPLQQILLQFYKQETKRLDLRKQSYKIQKSMLLSKLTEQLDIELPKYKPKVYFLHLYFYLLPNVSGSLYIRTAGVQYECIGWQNKRYFVIGDVNTEITLEFINNKSDEYTAKLKCMQGINRYTVQLLSTNPKQVSTLSYKVQYICGLFTQGHIEVLKKNRKFQHFMGSHITKQQLFDEFLRPVTECTFLNTYSRRLQKEDLGKKLKVIYSSGNKNYNQIEFYINWICVLPYTLQEKIKLIREYAANVSKEYFLSSCEELEKIFIFIGLKFMDFQIDEGQFLAYFGEQWAGGNREFLAPRIIKCRLAVPGANGANGTVHKLQAAAQAYLCQKSDSHLFCDIILPDLIPFILKEVQKSLINTTQATLTLVYSTQGQVKNLQIPLIKRKTNKNSSFTIDQSKYQLKNNQQDDISIAQPEILVTQVLPTFSKISTILDFVNNNKSIESLGKKEVRNVPEGVNLLKLCHDKFKNILPMRYEQVQETTQANYHTLYIPFLQTYHELTQPLRHPTVPKSVFLNNLQTDIKTICTFKNQLNFTDNKKIEETPLIKQLGLYGNLRILPPKTDVLYFFTLIEEEVLKSNAKIFVNYGYGVYRWEPCIVLGYFYTIKEKDNNLSKEKKAKKNFLVRHARSERIYRDFQLQMDPKVQENLPLLQTPTNSAPTNKSKVPAGDSASKRQLGMISSKKNMDSTSNIRRNN